VAGEWEQGWGFEEGHEVVGSATFRNGSPKKKKMTCTSSRRKKDMTSNEKPTSGGRRLRGISKKETISKEGVQNGL